MLCIYKITVSEKKVVELRFLDFNLENHPTCKYDYLEIRSRRYSFPHRPGKLCGYKMPFTMITQGNTAYIKFRTDGSVTKKGFKLVWRAIPKAAGMYISNSKYKSVIKLMKQDD